MNIYKVKTGCVTGEINTEFVLANSVDAVVKSYRNIKDGWEIQLIELVENQPIRIDDDGNLWDAMLGWLP